MIDRHIRILRLMAQQRQRELRNYDADDHNGGVASPEHRHRLQRAATRTSARVADAVARRRHLEMTLVAVSGGCSRPARPPIARS
jgi:hypothetical protein